MIVTGGQLMCLLKYKKKAFGNIMVKLISNVSFVRKEIIQKKI